MLFQQARKENKKKKYDMKNDILDQMLKFLNSEDVDVEVF